MTNLEKAQKLFRKALKNVEDWGYEFSVPISPILDTTDSVTFYGDYTRRNDYAIIRINIALINILDKNEKPFLTTVYHEIAHGIKHERFGYCFSHGRAWQKVANELSQKTGFEISTTSNYSNDGIFLEDNKPYKYKITCKDCQKFTLRYRASAVTKNPRNYRCRCGGELVVESNPK